MLADHEKQMVMMDTAELIRASGETGELLRPAVAGAGGFAGSYAPSEESLGSVPLEFQQLSPEELKQVGADGMCSLLPDAGVAEGDILVFNEVRYRVTDVKPVNCFGAVSHLVAKLEREYQKRD